MKEKGAVRGVEEKKNKAAYREMIPSFIALVFEKLMSLRETHPSH